MSLWGMYLIYDYNPSPIYCDSQMQETDVDVTLSLEEINMKIKSPIIGVVLTVLGWVGIILLLLKLPVTQITSYEGPILSAGDYLGGKRKVPILILLLDNITNRIINR